MDRKRSSSVKNGNYYIPTFELLSSSDHREGSTGIEAELEQSVEEILLDLGRWAIFAIRIPGYFPLSEGRTDSGRKCLELKFWTLPTAYTIFVGLLSVCGSIYFVNSYYENILFADPETLACYENTLTILWTTVLILVVYTTYLRCSRIFYIKYSLRFWREGMVSMVEGLVRNGYSLNKTYLKDISRSVFRTTVAYQLASLVRITFNAYNAYSSTFGSLCATPLEVVASYLDLFMSFKLCYHVGYSIWLTFLISVFTMCFQVIHDDLDLHAQSIGLGFSTGSHHHRNTTIPDQQDSHLPSFIFEEDCRQHSNYDREDLPTAEESREIEHMIRKTFATYELIEEHMQKFNAQFGVTLILETFFIFVYIVTSIYCVESFFKVDFLYALTQVIPVGIYTSAFYHLASESSVLSGKATGTLKKLENFFIPTTRPQLQILQLKVSIQAKPGI